MWRSRRGAYQSWMWGPPRRGAPQSWMRTSKRNAPLSDLEIQTHRASTWLWKSRDMAPHKRVWEPRHAGTKRLNWETKAHRALMFELKIQARPRDFGELEIQAHRRRHVKLVGLGNPSAPTPQSWAWKPRRASAAKLDRETRARSSFHVGMWNRGASQRRDRKPKRVRVPKVDVKPRRTHASERDLAITQEHPLLKVGLENHPGAAAPQS